MYREVFGMRVHGYDSTTKGKRQNNKKTTTKNLGGKNGAFLTCQRRALPHIPPPLAARRACYSAREPTTFTVLLFLVSLPRATVVPCLFSAFFCYVVRTTVIAIGTLFGSLARLGLPPLLPSRSRDNQQVLVSVSDPGDRVPVSGRLCCCCWPEG